MITGMPLTVAGAVLGSALLHAIWNALAKAIPYRLLASALMGASYLVFGAAWCALTPIPDRASWPFLAASVVLQTGYLLVLTAAYARGEFGRVYPVARGSAPLLVTVFSVTVLGERLQALPLIGIGLVAVGLAWLVFAPRGAAGNRAGPARRRGSSGLGLALATGCLIATYSLVDGVGVRQSGSAAGYAAWLMALQGPLLLVTCLGLAGPRQMADWLRGHPQSIPAASSVAHDGTPNRPRNRTGVMIASGIVGGVLSLAAYAIVLWAQSRASLSLVSATRETSVLFAGVIGALLFAEGFSARQTIAAVTVVAGVVLMQLH